MPCSCKNRRKDLYSYVWTSTDGAETKTYATQTEAEAKRIRKGGAWTKVPKSSV